MTGDDASEDVELGNRAWPRSEKVGVLGEGKSDAGDDCDMTEMGEDIANSSFCRALTICGNCNGLNSRMLC